jgi:hypothetical protein
MNYFITSRAHAIYMLLATVFYFESFSKRIALILRANSPQYPDRPPSNRNLVGWLHLGQKKSKKDRLTRS